MKATIKEISRITGYSSATVARVLANQSNVSKEAREKILEAMLDQNYRTTQCKKIKRELSEKNVMIIVDDISNYFYSGLLTHITEILNRNGFLTMVAVTNGSIDIELQYLKQAQNGGFVGMVLVTVSDTEQIRDFLQSFSFPTVLVNRYIKTLDLDVVCIDNYRGGYMAGEYLSGLGHQLIYHLAGPDYSSASQDRTRGFVEALEDFRVSFGENDIFYGDLKYKSGYRCGQEFISKKRRHTAVFCGNDIMAKGFADALEEGGKRIPDDLSLICFDNSPSAVSGKIGFTTIYRDPDTMGDMTANMLIERITMQRREPFKMIYPPQLLVRESCRFLTKQQKG